MAQNVKKVASKNLKKPKVAENSKSCQNYKKLPKISKVAEKLPSNLWLSLMNDVNFHSKRSINRKRLTAIFHSKKIKLFEVKLEVLYKHTICTRVS